MCDTHPQGVNKVSGGARLFWGKVFRQFTYLMSMGLETKDNYFMEAW